MQVLPFELEREIFELAGQSNVKYCELLAMMLVAHRCKEWIEPFMYRVMMKTGSSDQHCFPPSHLTNEDKQDILARPLYPKFGKHVRHLMLQGIHSSVAGDILGACVNVERLALWMIENRVSDLQLVLKDLPIRVLSVAMEELFEVSDPRTGWTWPFVIDPSIFPHLTHLDVFNMTTSAWEGWKPLASLPRLTHIAIDKYDDALFIEKLLQECRRLQLLLVLVANADRFAEPWTAEEFTKVDSQHDGRLVFMADKAANRLVDWEISARSGESDIWVRAEAMKNQGKDLSGQWRELYHPIYDDSDESSTCSP